MSDTVVLSSLFSPNSGNIVVVLAILGRVDVLSRITSEANVVVLNKPRENDGTSADADVLSLDSTLIINGEVSTVTALSALALLLCGGPFTARFHEAHASDFLRAYTTACFLVERGANVSGRTVAMDLYGVNASCYVSPVELLFAASIPGELFTEEFSGAPGHDLFVANTLHKLVADRARLFVANTPDKPVADRDHGSLPLAAITVSAFDNSAGTHFQVHPGAGVVWSAVAAGSGLALRALASKSWTTDQLLRPLTTTRLRFNPHHRTPVAYAVRRHATRPDIASFLLERTVEQARRCSGEDWRRLAGSVYRAAIVHQENEMHPPGDSCEALLFAALGAFARDIVNTLFLSMNRAAKAPEPTKQKLPFVDTYAKEMIAGVVLADFDKTMPKIPSGRLPIKAVVYRTNRVA